MNSTIPIQEDVFRLPITEPTHAAHIVHTLDTIAAVKMSVVAKADG
jgi:hypothetical protein